MNSDEKSTYLVIQNPIPLLREQAGFSKEDIAERLGCSLRKVDEIEEGIPNSPPSWLFFVLPTLPEHAEEYQEFRNFRRKIARSKLKKNLMIRKPLDFKQFLHDEHLTPQEFSTLALVPLPELFYAMRTRIPASVEQFFAIPT